jgi:hypothetical protein
MAGADGAHQAWGGVAHATMADRILPFGKGRRVEQQAGEAAGGQLGRQPVQHQRAPDGMADIDPACRRPGRVGGQHRRRVQPREQRVAGVDLAEAQITEQPRAAPGGRRPVAAEHPVEHHQIVAGQHRPSVASP